MAGAAIGAVVPLLGLLQGEYAGSGAGAVAMMMTGGAAGGAILFVFIALVGNVVFR